MICRWCGKPDVETCRETWVTPVCFACAPPSYTELPIERGKIVAEVVHPPESAESGKPSGVAHGRGGCGVSTAGRIAAALERIAEALERDSRDVIARLREQVKP